MLRKSFNFVVNRWFLPMKNKVASKSVDIV